MKKYTCIAVIIACVALLLAACSPPPVEELNKPFSNEGLRITATDMRVELCPLDDGYLDVTTYFLVENTTRRETIKPSVESSYVDTPLFLDDLPPRSSVEIYVITTVPIDAIFVRHAFYSNRKENVGAAAYFWLEQLVTQNVVYDAMMRSAEQDD
jgi:hypothetical protein